MRIFLAVLAVLAIGAELDELEAQTVCREAPTCTLSWTPPVTYTDGSPLVAAELAGYDFDCRDQDGDAVPVAAVLMAVSSVRREFPRGGVYQCRIITRDIFGRSSSPSEPSNFFTVPRPNPMPATGLAVE